MTDNKNKIIFSRIDVVNSLESKKAYAYDEKMERIRQELVESQVYKDSVIMDLGCGTGRYALPYLKVCKHYYGIDFSESMILQFKDKILDDYCNSYDLIHADFMKYDFGELQCDLIYSFGTLYYVEEIERAIEKIGKILKPGGRAILEIGNALSINSRVNMLFHEAYDWPEPKFSKLDKVRASFLVNNMSILNCRSFQIFPMYGSPPGASFLKLFTTEKWKTLLQMEIAGKMIDEHISSNILFRKYAFRHIYLLQKKI